MQFQQHSCGIIGLPYYKIITIVPVITKRAPINTLRLTVSCKIMMDNMIARATLVLSTAATDETFPICKALK